MSIRRKIVNPTRTQKPASSFSVAWSNVCRKTSPSSDPAARACPKERTGESAALAALGKAKSSRFGAREIRLVEINAAARALVETIVTNRKEGTVKLVAGVVGRQQQELSLRAKINVSLFCIHKLATPFMSPQSCS